MKKDSGWEDEKERKYDNGPQVALAALLSQSFTRSDLQRLARDYAPELIQGLRWSNIPFRAALDLIGILSQSGRLNKGFFELLINERPRQQFEIAHVAKQYDIRLTISDITSPKMQPRTLVCVHAKCDTEAFARIVTHTEPLVQGRWITLHAVQTVDELDSLLPEADMILALLSAELLQSELGHELGYSLDTFSNNTLYLSVVLRRCLWEQTPLGARRPMFDDAIEQASSPEQLWAELATRIAQIAETRDFLDEEVALIEPPSPSLIAVPIHQIFSTSGTPELTLVETAELRRLDYELANFGKALVLEGPSGTGKTSAALAATSRARNSRYQAWSETYFQCKVENERVRLATLVKGPLRNAQGFVLVDDFHELDTELQKQIGQFAKATLDIRNHTVKFILIGINGMGSTLIGNIADLGGGRATVIPFGRQPDAVVLEMVKKGERAANVVFTRKRDIALDVRGSLMLAQLICEKMLLQQEVTVTQRIRRTIATRVHEVRASLLADLRDQFHQRLQEFVALDLDCERRGAGIAVLWSLSRNDRGSVTITDVRGIFSDLEESFLVLAGRASDPARWRELLFWSPADGRIAITDPKLDFYLRELPWEQFARDCGVHLTHTADGLGFVTAKRPSTLPIPAITTRSSSHTTSGVSRAKVGDQSTLRILHLSDLHFRTGSGGTSWDSATVLERLVVDIASLGDNGHKPDLIVITGDVAFSGQRNEYELAKKWICEELLPAAQLTPREVVITPGNHDADRKAIGVAARSVQATLLASKRDADLVAVLDVPAERACLLARHTAFTEFLNNLGAGGRTWSVPWGSVVYAVHGATVRIAAFCSSFMSCGDEDHGRMLLSLWQANELLRGSDGDDLVISAMHHPWSYFAEFDEAARLEVRRSSSIVLRGHLHVSSVEQIISSDHSGLVEIAAGACYESSRYPNAYSLIETNLKTRKVVVLPRVWNTRRRSWQADNNMVPGAELSARLREPLR
ncbi:MAG: metallophosphoesterase [Myxococcales bacterium]|nr:metallophosphoesterase [Myxococcales bacterium]